MSMLMHFQQVSPELLQKILNAPDNIDSIVESEEEMLEELDIGKSWHGIHYFLTQSDYDSDSFLFNVIFGGHEIGEDVGYGPMRYMSPEDVKQVSIALSGVSDETLSANYNPEDMMKKSIYPQIWEDEEDNPFGYITDYYHQLVKYYQDADQKGNALLVFMD